MSGCKYPEIPHLAANPTLANQYIRYTEAAMGIRMAA